MHKCAYYIGSPQHAALWKYEALGEIPEAVAKSLEVMWDLISRTSPNTEQTHVLVKKSGVYWTKRHTHKQAQTATVPS